MARSSREGIHFEMFRRGRFQLKGLTMLIDVRLNDESEMDLTEESLIDIVDGDHGQETQGVFHQMNLRIVSDEIDRRENLSNLNRRSMVVDVVDDQFDRMIDGQCRTHLRAGILCPNGQQQLIVQLEKRNQFVRRQGHRLQNGQTTGSIVQREIFEEFLIFGEIRR